MKGLSTKNLLIVLIIVNLLGIGGYSFLYWQVVKQHTAAQMFAEELVYEVDRETRLRSLGDLVEEITEDRSLISSHFTSSDEVAVVSYITTLEGLPQYVPVPVSLQSVKIDGDPELGTGSLSLFLSTTDGSPSATKLLIEIVESLPTVTIIDSASITISENAETGTLWDTSLTLRALVSE